MGKVPSHSLSAESCSVAAGWEAYDDGDVVVRERALGVGVVCAQSDVVWVVRDSDDVAELAVAGDDVAVVEHGGCVIVDGERVKPEVWHGVHVESTLANYHRLSWPMCEDLVCPIESRHADDYAFLTEVDMIDDVTQD